MRHSPKRPAHGLTEYAVHPHSAGAEDFGTLEHRGWQEVASRYEDAFAALTAQSIEPLLDAVGAAAGTRLLDVASGPGHLTATAASRGAIATGLDFSPAMVARARAAHPRARFIEASAQALPFPAASFDAVVISYGMLHFPDADQALREVFRVLRPGGRLGFTVWSGPERALGFGLVNNAIRAHGNPDVSLPPGPPLFRFSEAGECHRVLAQLGFAGIRVIEVPQVWRFSSASAWIEGMERGTVRTAATLRKQSPAALARIRATLLQDAQAWQRNDGSIELPMPAVLACATRP